MPSVIDRLSGIQDDLAEITEALANVANLTKDAAFSSLALRLAAVTRELHEAVEQFVHP